MPVVAPAQQRWHMSSMTPLATIRCYNDLVDALRARKAELGLSDDVLDEVAGLTKGHTNKVLGPSRERGIGAATLEAYLIALAIDLVMVENAKKLVEMQPYYSAREETRVRINPAIGDRVLSRAMKKLAKDRWAKVPPEQRSEIARRLSWQRWAKTHACDTEKAL